MGKFKMRSVSGSLVIHSHLPAVNSKAFMRFVDEHLLAKNGGPSHAQIGLANACPQHCEFCYSRKRSGKLLNNSEIIRLIQELKKLGVFWLGFTGGEPLMNRGIVDIVKSAGDDIALKLFTTGAGLTEELAHELKAAGLLYVSVSLDHWDEVVNDGFRGLEGAFQTALKAINIFKDAGMHISVSSVVSREMIQKNQVHNLIRFLINLGVHEAWLSEAKPADEAFWNIESVITSEEKAVLMQIQEQYNSGNEITVNYLGHFEDGSNFGCNAGNKMVYIDSFGEVSPCVFIPMTFGNIRDRRVDDILTDMKACFPTESECFINKNFELLKKYSHGQIPLGRDDSLELLKEVDFSPLPEFSLLNSSK
jgi:MoaA/NifB/PqqE/SkfB family radical SAM enzyme